MTAHAPIRTKTGTLVEVTYRSSVDPLTGDDQKIVTGTLYGKTRDTVTVGDLTIARSRVLRLRPVRGMAVPR